MRRKSLIRHNKKGFTFVECIVAVALFAIIGTLAFSMFNNSARYMSKAKKEEEKQSQATMAAQSDTYKNSDGLYIIFSAKTLVIEYSVINNMTIANYYASIIYSTDYGDVTIMTAIAPAADANGEQPGHLIATSYTRYKVLSDGYSGSKILVGRYIYIFDNSLQTENSVLDKLSEYNDVKKN